MEHVYFFPLSHIEIDRDQESGSLLLFSFCLTIFKFGTHTLKSNRNATLSQWKIYRVLLNILDWDNKTSRFQEMLMISIKRCLK